MGADQLDRLARSRLVAERDPLVTLDFELELRAHRGREGSGARVGPGEGESPVVALEPARGSDELLDAVRALERPQVEETQLVLAGRRPAALGGEHLQRHTGARRQLPAVEPREGLEQAAARPQQAIRVPQDVALEVELEPCRQLARQEPVQDRLDLA